MRKNLLYSFSVLLLLSGCAHKRFERERSVKTPDKAKKVQVEKHIDIPLASDEVKSYFDDSDDINLGEFVLVEDAQVQEKQETTPEPQEIDLNINTSIENELFR